MLLPALNPLVSHSDVGIKPRLLIHAWKDVSMLTLHIQPLQGPRSGQPLNLLGLPKCRHSQVPLAKVGLTQGTQAHIQRLRPGPAARPHKRGLGTPL